MEHMVLEISILIQETYPFSLFCVFSA